MASHVVGPLLVASRQLEADEITTLDETAEWTFTLLEVIPPLVSYPPEGPTWAERWARVTAAPRSHYRDFRPEV